MPIEPPLLVTLGFDRPTFESLDRLRSLYFPPDRNVVPAHLSLFHHLPGDESGAIDRELSGVARSSRAISLTFPAVKRMSRGLMLPAEAPGLAAIRAGLARVFDRWLTPQDRQPFHPHVTIMNKADRDEAEAAHSELSATWATRTGIGDRLILWRYLGGPWEEIESYPFEGSSGAPMPRAEPGRAIVGNPGDVLR